MKLLTEDAALEELKTRFAKVTRIAAGQLDKLNAAKTYVEACEVIGLPSLLPQCEECGVRAWGAVRLECPYADEEATLCTACLLKGICLANLKVSCCCCGRSHLIQTENA